MNYKGGYMKASIYYDEADPLSIEAYGKKLIGKTFQDVCNADDLNQIKEVVKTSNYEAKHEDKKRKGGLGELIEERYFHYAANSDSNPDFDKAGVELKVTPYKINKNKTLSAKERLILTMIDYCSVVNESFEESHLWNKAKLILLVYYLYEEGLKRLDYRIDYVKLFTPPEQDLKVIQHDYQVIVDKIKAGKAHELSEGDTLYLGAATKSATSKNRTTQPYSDIPAKPRAFSFKTSYMTYVLNNYIVPGKRTYEPIIKDGETVDSLEKYVTDKLDMYVGKTMDELCKEFEIDTTKKPKDIGAIVAYNILGIKGNTAEEFVKANVAVKTIRIEHDNRIKENMSFPAIKYKEIVKEKWDDSTFGNYLRETKFLFVVYKFDDNGELRLRGGQFWNIPYEDLENDVKEVWTRTRDVLDQGLKITVTKRGRTTNFPKAKENRVCHVRPHATTVNDVYELPDGRSYTKHCFWLNNSYILSQLDDKFKKD